MTTMSLDGMMDSGSPTIWHSRLTAAGCGLPRRTQTSRRSGSASMIRSAECPDRQACISIRGWFRCGRTAAPSMPQADTGSHALLDDGTVGEEFIELEHVSLLTEKAPCPAKPGWEFMLRRESGFRPAVSQDCRPAQHRRGACCSEIEAEIACRLVHGISSLPAGSFRPAFRSVAGTKWRLRPGADGAGCATNFRYPLGWAARMGGR